MVTILKMNSAVTLRKLLLASCLLCFVATTLCSANEATNTTTRGKSRPSYFELRRKKITTAATSTASSVSQKSIVSETEDDEEAPRVIGNSRGGAEFISKQEPIAEKSKDKIAPPRVTASRTTKSGGKSYLEYFRPGARPRQVTTKAPRKLPTFEDSQKTEAPNGCNQCRFYCKQCKGTEEVSSGGAWGCCNHNCCGGRCSCHKLT